MLGGHTYIDPADGVTEVTPDETLVGFRFLDV
jgi:hypothetical protein